jgi:adenosylcobinamide kinase/adenosylcobinamide-phosphate guanylyltransferase
MSGLAARLTFVTGGERSGKSAFAERLAARLGPRITYLATARASDAEMRARIAAHRARRPSSWRTLDAPLDVTSALGDSPTDGVLLDDLGLLVANLMQAEAESAGVAAAPLAACERRLDAELAAILAAATNGPPWVVVSPQVGMGLVPLTPVARQFVDLVGRANRIIGRHATAAYFVVAGFALDLREIGTPIVE